MRKAAVTANLLQPSSAFFLLHGHEVAVLDSLPLWMTRLFLAVVRCTDFKTGAGSTTYAQLVLMLTPLQARSGPRTYVPDEQAVKKGVRAFETRRILARDKARSQEGTSLFFMVCDRHVKARPTSKLDPPTRPPVDRRKPSNGAAFRGDA